MVTDSEVLEAIRGHPLAGGEGYEPDLHPDEDADVIVSSVSGLLDEISGTGKVIGIEDGRYNLTGHQVEIGRDTLVGYRDWDGSDGALLYTNDGGRTSPYRYHRMFHSSTGGCRLSGFRMRGHDPYDSFTRGDYDRNLSNGIKIRGPGAEIDNMEMWGFPWCSVHLRGGSSRATADIHHNHFHDNLQLGYGYGVNFWRNSEGDVYLNYFNTNRHSVNGRGNADIDYRVHDNLFGPDMNNHCVDMHCLEENSIRGRNDNPDSPMYRLRAGGMLEVYRNTFLDASTPGIGIRGYPYKGADVYKNRFAHSSRPSRNPDTHRTSAPWYVQNMTWGDLEYPPRDREGYPSNWSDWDNEFGVSRLDLSHFGEAADTETPRRQRDEWEEIRAQRVAMYRGLSSLRAALAE